ncbi:CBF/NF-Y family transcription factor [Diplocarpon rosae]|nr:CBF/NF-Y family transcription factor [Diplocarpon rosae]
MPPRKSDASKAATGDEATPGKDAGIVNGSGINIEVWNPAHHAALPRSSDLSMPKSIVTRLAKGVLPPNTQIQGNATIAISKSATVFVNYVSSHANEHAAASNRKTITPQDIFNALDDLEFPDFRNRLEAELAKYNEVQTDKRNVYRSKVASKASGTGEEEVAEDRDGQPAAKKAKLETGQAGEEEVEGADETQDEAEAEEEEGDAQDESDDEEGGRLEDEERLEDIEVGEVEDEALDNGEDSD